jgi:VanZ family protein
VKALVALLASVLIVFGSPYAGQLRGALQSSFPVQYRWIVGGVVAVAALVAIGSAVVRLRGQRPLESSTADRGSTKALGLRYASIVLAVTLSAIYARVVSSGNPDVDVVEAFHFVEYGLVAYLFYRAWRSRPDLSGVVFAACAGLAVGVADEWVQWFVPGRVGEVHDVALNAVAVGCGLLFSMAVRPPASLHVPLAVRSRLAIGVALSGLIIAVAGFIDRVHLGYEVNDGQVGVFRSQYDAKTLAATAANRPVRWSASPPPVGGFRREDHYLSEGLWHVQRRNLAITAGDPWTAWNENAILERFYAPVLDRGARWPAEQRSVIEQSAHGSARGSYVSDAAPYPIYLVRRSTFWLATVLIGVATLWSAFAKVTG